MKVSATDLSKILNVPLNKVFEMYPNGKIYKHFKDNLIEDEVFYDIEGELAKIVKHDRNRKYDIIYSKKDKLFNFIFKDGKCWVSSLELTKHAQIAQKISVWVYYKARVSLDLKKGLDYYINKRSHKDGVTEYYFTVDSAKLMLHHVEKAKSVLGNLIYNYDKFLSELNNK